MTGATLGQEDVVAAAFRSIPALEQLLAVHPDLIEARSGTGETALSFLAIENQLEAVVCLVRHGANPHTADDFGGTPLMYAATLGYYELLGYLLSLKPDVNARNKMEATALFQAAQGGQLECMDLLLAAGADPALHDGLNSIFEAPLDEHRNKVHGFLIQRGLDPKDFPSPFD